MGTGRTTIAGKSFRDYIAAVWKFLLIAFILIVISAVWRLTLGHLRATPIVQNIVGLLGVLVIGWAGWTAARRHKFSLKQMWFVGLLFLIPIIWTLPIFHNGLEILFLIVVNAVIYMALATFGGWLGRVVKRGHP